MEAQQGDLLPDAGPEDGLPEVAAGALQAEGALSLRRPGQELRRSRPRDAPEQGQAPLRPGLQGDLEEAVPGQVPLQLLRGAGGHHPAVVDDEDAVAHRLDLGQDVGAEDDGVGPGQVPDEGADLDDLLGVQAHSGLVQNDDLRVPQQGLGDAHPLAVALGQVADEPALHAGEHGEPGHPLQLLLPVPGGDPLQGGGEGEVLLHRHVGVEGRLLRQVADAALGRLGLLGHAVAVHQDLPLGGAQVAGHDVHGGGFSRPVGAQEAVGLASLHREAQVVHRRVAAVPLHQVSHLDQGLFLLYRLQPGPEPVSCGRKHSRQS